MRNVCTGFACAVALASAANADVITSTATFPVAALPYSGSATLNQFDDMGGTRVLDGVVIRMGTSLSAHIVATNDAAVSQTISIGLAGSASAGAFPGGAGLSDGFSASASSPLLGPGAGHDFGTFGDTASDSQSVISLLWPLYIGGGTFSVPYSGNALFGIQGTSDAHIDVTDFAGSGYLEFDYTHHTLSTPAAAASVVLLGLGASRRRRA